MVVDPSCYANIDAIESIRKIIVSYSSKENRWKSNLNFADHHIFFTLLIWDTYISIHIIKCLIFAFCHYMYVYVFVLVLNEKRFNSSNRIVSLFLLCCCSVYVCECVCSSSYSKMCLSSFLSSACTSQAVRRNLHVCGIIGLLNDFVHHKNGQKCLIGYGI